MIMQAIYLHKYAIAKKQTNLKFKVSRDRSFTATKSKRTRKKILAQENTGMRYVYVIDKSLIPTFDSS